jgi:iron complex outermembrane receptor protein
LSSQSGDHGEPIDPTLVERIEVVRGPATLLYGSNAVGGVVNAVSPENEMHEKPHQGLSGNVGSTVGSNNSQGGGSGNFRYGIGNFQLWGGGGGMRAGDYSSPLGLVPNSATHMKDGRFGVGRFSEKTSASFVYDVQDGRYGVPFASSFGGEEDDIDLVFRRHQVRFSGAVRDLGKYFEQFSLKVSYSDWNHKELEGNEIGTQFFNKQFTYRGEMQQKKLGRWSGSFGFWGLARDYKSVGLEALSPPVNQNAFALFGVEQLELERRVRLQFGARFEHNAYDPLGLNQRSFNGLSSSAGINVSLWTGGVFVTNFTHSFRAPALEELYNNGPHVGNLAFEVGDASLKAERANGLDMSLRHQGQKFRAEANFFRYGMQSFVYGAPTGEIEDGLLVLKYSQADARFTGTELKASTALNSKLWLNLGLDAVRAHLTEPNLDLPRIPPVRGRVGLDYSYKNLSVRPELVLTNRQSHVFPAETETAGYALPNLTASYSIPRQHAIHVFTVNAFNLSDTLYRNHLSFIKQLAPEMGRGIRFSYNVHFY